MLQANERIKDHLHLVGEHRRYLRCRAVIGNGNDVGAGCMLEQFTGKVKEGRACGVVELAGVGLGIGDQFGHIVGRNAGLDPQHEAQSGHVGDGRKVFDRVKRELEDRRVHHHGTGGECAQHIAIGGCLGHEIGANRAVCAGFVLDQERLPKRLGEPLRHHTRDHIRAGARADWDNHLDRSAWVGRLR